MCKSCMLFECTCVFTTYHHKRTVSSFSMDMCKYINAYDMVRVQTCFCTDGLANLVSSILQVALRSSILQVRGIATAMLRIACFMVYPNMVCCIHIFNTNDAVIMHELCYIHRRRTPLFITTSDTAKWSEISFRECQHFSWATDTGLRPRCNVNWMWIPQTSCGQRRRTCQRWDMALSMVFSRMTTNLSHLSHIAGNELLCPVLESGGWCKRSSNLWVFWGTIHCLICAYHVFQRLCMVCGLTTAIGIPHWGLRSHKMSRATMM